MSLKGEKKQLESIVNLLVEWFNKDREEATLLCLLTMACARDSIDTLVSVIDILSKNPGVLAADFDQIDRVLEVDFVEKQPKILDIHHHKRGFHYLGRKTPEHGCSCSEAVKRTVILDYPYLIISNETGCQLSRIGTGYEGSLAGYVYGKSDRCLGPGLYAKVGDLIIQRPLALDKEVEKFGYALKEDFQVQSELCNSETLRIAKREVKSVAMLHWKGELVLIRQVFADQESLNILPYAHLSIVDFCEIGSNGDICLKRRILLLKNTESEESMEKIHQLLRQPNSANEEDKEIRFPADSQSTSCGLRLVTLQECVFTVSDQFLTILAPNTDRGAKAVKMLGTAYSYNLDSGILHAQSELTVDPTLVPPSLPKGFSIHSSGLTYSAQHHTFWTVTYNRLDEFKGPIGMESASCLKRRFSKEIDLASGSSNLISKLLMHASILAMKSTHFTLKKETLSSLGSMMRKNPGWATMCVSILEKADFTDSCDSSALLETFDEFLNDCDDCNVIKTVLKLKQKISPLDDHYSVLSGKNPQVNQCLRQMKIQQVVKQAPKNVHNATFMQCIREELECLSKEVVKGCKQCSPELEIIIDCVLTVGQWAKVNDDFKPFFTNIAKLVLEHMVIFAKHLISRDSVEDKINFLPTLLSPALVGPLACMIDEVDGLARECQEHLLELSQLVSKLMLKFGETGVGKVEQMLPWAFTRNIESPHPVTEGYKFQETLKLPGAKCLLLVFDPACCTTTDSDRLIVYSGNGPSKRVVECCGNFKTTRRIGQKPWPKKPIIIFGDTVTLDFEVRARQEADLSWGFRVYVGHCLSETLFLSAANLGPLEDALMTLLPVLAKETRLQFSGTSQTDEERQCHHLLSSKILQRCLWQEDKVGQQLQMLDNQQQSALSDDILPPPPLSLIPSKTVATLRNLSGIGLPIMRESTKKLIQPHLLEETIVSVIIKHMCLTDTLDAFLLDEDPTTPDACLLADIMVDVYLKISSLIRRLQGIAELEQKWCNEVCNVREDLVSMKDVFFSDYIHHESRTKDLELLCYLKNIGGGQEKPQKALQRLKDLLLAESSMTTTAEAGKGQSQTKMLVKGIFGRLDILLKAELADRSDHLSTPPVMSMSLQHWPSTNEGCKTLKKQMSMEFEKAMDDSILQFTKLNRSISRMKQSRSIIEGKPRLISSECE